MPFIKLYDNLTNKTFQSELDISNYRLIRFNSRFIKDEIRSYTFENLPFEDIKKVVEE